MPETVDLQGFEGICPRGEKKPIGYLIFLSPLFFFFWGQIWGQNERNPESMGISGIFHLSPYFEDGDKRSENPCFMGVIKGSILSRFSCSGDKRGQNENMGGTQCELTRIRITAMLRI